MGRIRLYAQIFKRLPEKAHYLKKNSQTEGLAIKYTLKE